MLRLFRTPKGTDLPLLNLRGKEYLEVKYRLVWFREEHPDWAIETNIVSITPTEACSRAVIKDGQGRTVATSHKCETQKGFPDFLEKAETGSIGRALALCGYGTQFCADELDEGERVVDSPVGAKAPVVKANQKIWPFPYPEGCKSRPVEEFGGDELVQCETSLTQWKTGKSKSSYPKDGDRWLAYIGKLIDAKAVKS